MPVFTTSKAEAPKEFHVPAGDYKFEVIEAKDKPSSAGNEMIEMTIMPYVNGKPGPRLFDHLVFTKNARWKIDQFLMSCGEHPGEGKEIDINAEKIIGYKGEARLAVETGNNGRKRNKVVAYLFDEWN